MVGGSHGRRHDCRSAVSAAHRYASMPKLHRSGVDSPSARRASASGCSTWGLPARDHLILAVPIAAFIETEQGERRIRGTIDLWIEGSWHFGVDVVIGIAPDAAAGYGASGGTARS